MAGYTPIFESIATGTLYGRWPDIGLWPIVLALADKHGVLDVTPAYLAGVTGLLVQEVVACMGRFCAPDPYSRTKVEAGARLRLIDAHRDWGWIIINHAKYREKARLMAKDAARTASGRDAERKREERGLPVPRCPPESPSQTQTQTHKEGEAGKPKGKPKSPKTIIPDDFTLTPELEQYAIDRLPAVDVGKLLESFRGKAIAKEWQYANWRQAFQEFVRNSAPNSGHWASGQYPRSANAEEAWR